MTRAERTFIQDKVDYLYARYRAGGPPPLGDCQVIAGMICQGVPQAEPVGGICSDAEDSGAHWWAELPDGTVLDPLGADWQAGGIQARDPQVRGVPALLHALRRTWLDRPDVLALADRLEQGRLQVSSRGDAGSCALHPPPPILCSQP